jgi:hypothetical protein
MMHGADSGFVVCRQRWSFPERPKETGLRHSRHRQRFGEPLRIGQMPLELAVAIDAVRNFNGANQDAVRQLRGTQVVLFIRV